MNESPTEDARSPIPGAASPPRSAPVPSGLWRKLLVGLGWLALLAALGSGVTGVKFWVMGLAVTGIALVVGVLVLVWLTLWAVGGRKPGQFAIGSLFFLTLFVALWLTAARWLAVAIQSGLLAVAIPSGGPTPPQTGFATFAAALGLLPLIAVSIPILAPFLESLLWIAVSILRRPWVQRSIAVLRRPPRANR